MQEKLNRAEKVNVSLYETQRLIIQQHAEKSGIGTFSAALRMIVNEWAREHPQDWQAQPVAEVAA